MRYHSIPLQLVDFTTFQNATIKTPARQVPLELREMPEPMGKLHVTYYTKHVRYQFLNHLLVNRDLQANRATKVPVVSTLDDQHQRTLAAEVAQQDPKDPQDQLDQQDQL